MRLTIIAVISIALFAFLGAKFIFASWPGLCSTGLSDLLSYRSVQPLNEIFGTCPSASTQQALSSIGCGFRSVSAPDPENITQVDAFNQCKKLDGEFIVTSSCPKISSVCVTTILPQQNSTKGTSSSSLAETIVEKIRSVLPFFPKTESTIDFSSCEKCDTQSQTCAVYNVPTGNYGTCEPKGWNEGSDFGWTTYTCPDGLILKYSTKLGKPDCPEFSTNQSAENFFAQLISKFEEIFRIGQKSQASCPSGNYSCPANCGNGKVCQLVPKELYAGCTYWQAGCVPIPELFQAVDSQATQGCSPDVIETCRQHGFRCANGVCHNTVAPLTEPYCFPKKITQCAQMGKNFLCRPDNVGGSCINGGEQIGQVIQQERSNNSLCNLTYSPAQEGLTRVYRTSGANGSGTLTTKISNVTDSSYVFTQDRIEGNSKYHSVGTYSCTSAGKTITSSDSTATITGSSNQMTKTVAHQQRTGIELPAENDWKTGTSYSFTTQFTSTTTQADGTQTTVTGIQKYRYTITGKEQITVPAGTFDAFKLNYTFTGTNNVAAPNGKILSTADSGSGVSWSAAGIGSIKTTLHMDNGAQDQVMELSSK